MSGRGRELKNYDCDYNIGDACFRVLMCGGGGEEMKIYQFSLVNKEGEKSAFIEKCGRTILGDEDQK